LSLETLNWVRLITPGVLIYLLWNSCIWILGTGKFQLPEKVDEVSGLLLTLIVGGIWYYLGVRDRTNAQATQEIQNNLVTQMRAAIPTHPNRDRLTWAIVSRVFYHYVDKDASLTQQSHMAYWNGAFWSFAADLRMASGLAVVAYAAIALAGETGWTQYSAPRCFLAFVTAAVLFVVSIELTRSSTQKQIEIGTRQIQSMVLMYDDELRPKLTAIANALR